MWVMRMAWRDTRGSRAHLVMSMVAMAIGLAALVAIQSFGRRLDATIQEQTKILLGADLSIRSLQPLSQESEEFLLEIPGDHVRETRFLSMVTAKSSGETQLSQIRALTGPFPFYGELRAQPADSATTFLDNPDLALAEESLLLQLEIEVGDELRVGDRVFTIAGALLDISGELPVTAGFIGPRVFISASALQGTGLLGDESLARYLVHVRLPAEESATNLLEKHRRRLADLRLEMETAEQRQAALGRLLDQVYLYLTIGALTAVLLGGIGCAGSIQLYARRKRTIAATLRCLGAPVAPTFAIYLTQAAGASLIGGITGALVGTVLQELIPQILADFLPFEIAAVGSASAILLSILMGMAVSFAFTAWPLIGLRQVAPLEAVRSDGSVSLKRDPWQWALGVVLWGLLLLFCIVQANTWQQGIILVVTLTIIFTVLALSAKLVMRGARLLVSRVGSFTWRQGIANIHRPFNQTTLLLLSLGLGAFLLSTLSLTQTNLLRQFRGDPGAGQPNMILFNIQPNQREGVLELIQAEGVTIDEVTPIVTKRLESVNGISIAELRDDPERDIPHWVLFREYRSTFRDQLLPRDELIAGRWEPYDGIGPIPVSIASELADYLEVGINDRLLFNLQGVQLDTVIRSIRRVDWREMRTNFFVIFPSGVLEEAPHNFAVVAMVPSAEVGARLQRAIVRPFPNVSAIDLRLLLSSINRIVDQAAYVIRFMALFSVLTGLTVLGATVVATRYDRAEETRLLRTLGASRGQLRRIMAAEYIVLGGVASMSGVGLAVLASWGASRWLFNMPFQVPWRIVALLPASITLLTLMIGYVLTQWTGRLPTAR